MLLDIEEDEEDLAALQAEIDKFEAWTEKVRPLLGDPAYEPTFEEKLLAIRILGISATVYPETAPQRLKLYRLFVAKTGRMRV